jgi:hypothetical protein
MSYIVQLCRPEHIRSIRDRLRVGDLREITCMGLTAKTALWASYKHGLMAKAAIQDDKALAVWGCGGRPMGDVGNPWLLTAPEVEKLPVSMVKEAKRAIGEMAMVFPRLENWVASEYAQACKFVEVLGFTLDTPIPIGPHQAMFRRFWLER